jgi:transposase
LLCHQAGQDEQGLVRVRVWSDWQEHRRLAERYFGLRVLITGRTGWSTPQIIEAYRGQSAAESSFRDLKDPGMLSTRPQFHCTDQKLHVHAFLFFTAYLLVTLLHRRAARLAGYQGSSRRLLTELAEIRCCRLIEVTGRKGRPRVRWQVEEFDETRTAMAQVLGALPEIS